MLALLVAAWFGHCLASEMSVPTWKAVSFRENALEPFPHWSNQWAKLRGGVWLSGSDGSFQGSYSGLAIWNASKDSVYLLALSDNASIAELKVMLSATGVLHVESMRQTFLLDSAGVTIQGQGYGTIFEAMSVMGDELLVTTEPYNIKRNGVERWQSALWRYNLSGILQGEANSNWAQEVIPLGTCSEGSNAGVEGLMHLPGAGALAVCEESGKAWFVARERASSALSRPLELQMPSSLHQDMRISGMVMLPRQGGAHMPTDSFEGLALMTNWRTEIEGHSSMQLAGLVFNNTATGWQLQAHPKLAPVQLDSADGYPVENVEGIALAEVSGQHRLLIITDSSNNRFNYGCERTVLLEFEFSPDTTSNALPGKKSLLRRSSRVSPIRKHTVPTPSPTPPVALSAAVAAAAAKSDRAYCGPQSVDGFAQARAGFWMPPPNSRLIGAAVFTRHGDRTALPRSNSTCVRYTKATSPLRSLRRCAKFNPKVNSQLKLEFVPTDSRHPWAGADAVQLLAGSTLTHDGQLTKLGTAQLHEVGQLYGQRYKKLALDMRNITARSTPVSRTVMSAESFFNGLQQSFPQPSSTLQLGVEAGLSATFAPLEDVPSISSNATSDIAARVLLKHSGLWNRLLQKDDWLPKNFLATLSPLLDCLRVSFCWGKTWAWPEQFQEISVRQELQDMQLEYFREFFQLRQPSGATHAEVVIRDVLREALFRIAQGGFHLYSGHDTTLLPLFSALQLPDFTWPPLAAHLTFELYEVDGARQVAVLLNGKLQSPGRCHGELCQLDELLLPSAACGSGAIFMALLIACTHLVALVQFPL